ncbi:MAG: hypothetical protein AAFP28_08560 [Pseudomonadota bacterium]
MHALPNRSALDATQVALLGVLLASDFREAFDPSDLRRRLGFKGFGIKAGNLVTLPHGKVVCPLHAVGG